MKKLSTILTRAKKYHELFNKGRNTEHFMCLALNRAASEGKISDEEVETGKEFCMKLVHSISPDHGSLRGALILTTHITNESDLNELIRKTWLDAIENLKREGN